MVGKVILGTLLLAVIGAGFEVGVNKLIDAVKGWRTGR